MPVKASLKTYLFISNAALRGQTRRFGASPLVCERYCRCGGQATIIKPALPPEPPHLPPSDPQVAALSIHYLRGGCRRLLCASQPFDPAMSVISPRLLATTSWIHKTSERGAEGLGLCAIDGGEITRGRGSHRCEIHCSRLGFSPRPLRACFSPHRLLS